MSSREAGAQEWLSRADIALRSTSASTAIERRRWQVIGLLADGLPLAEIEARTGCRPRTIRQIAQRYRECGPAGLADGRQPGPESACIASAAGSICGGWAVRL